MTDGPEPASDAAPVSGVVTALAVGGLVLALVPCCPLTGSIGAVLGLIALRRARGTDAVSRRIARVARVAVIVGIAGSIISLIVLDRVQTWLQARLDEGARASIIEAVNASTAGAPERVRAVWMSGVSPDDQAIEAFAAALGSGPGDLQRVEIVSAEPVSSALPVFDLALVLTFEVESRLGTARIQLLPTALPIGSDVRLRVLAIETEEGTPIRLGPPWEDDLKPTPPP